MEQRPDRWIPRVNSSEFSIVGGAPIGAFRWIRCDGGDSDMVREVAVSPRLPLDDPRVASQSFVELRSNVIAPTQTDRRIVVGMRADDRGRLVGAGSDDGTGWLLNVQRY